LQVIDLAFAFALASLEEWAHATIIDLHKFGPLVGGSVMAQPTHASDIVMGGKTH
jgi:hypothetical protein